MKRKVAFIIALIAVTIFFVRPFPEKKQPQTQDISVPNVQEEPVPEAPAEKAVEVVSAPATEPEEKKEEVTVAPIVEEQVVLSVEAVPEVAEPVAEESVPEEISYEDETVSIMMISVCDAEESDVQFATVVPNNSHVKGFHILGNPNNKPLDLVVKSRDVQGCEKIHFLDWNVQRPNEFELCDALGNDTTVGIYANKVQVARFSVPVNAPEEYVSFDLSRGKQLAFAH